MTSVYDWHDPWAPLAAQQEHKTPLAARRHRAETYLSDHAQSRIFQSATRGQLAYLEWLLDHFSKDAVKSAMYRVAGVSRLREVPERYRDQFLRDVRIDLESSR